MKRKTKAILLLTGIMVGCVIIGGLVGVANETSWDHALGRDKVAGEEVLFEFAKTGTASKYQEDDSTYVVRGNFADEGMSSYAYTLSLNTTDDFIAANEADLTGGMEGWKNINSAELIIHGYTGYIDEIELVGQGSIKGEADVIVYVDGKRFGKETLSATSDTYSFDYPWLVQGEIKIVVKQHDVDNCIKLSSVTINPAE